MRSLLRLFGLLFVFKKPRFIHLDFVDLIIANKPLFLIAWKGSYLYKIRVKEVKETFYKKEGSFILQLPIGVKSVEVVVSNFWHRSRIYIPLKHIELDEEATSLLIQKFKPLGTLEIKKKPLSLVNTKAIIPGFYVKPDPFSVAFKKVIKINNQKFKYP